MGGECNIRRQGKSVAFPIFLRRDKTVFSGLPTELMRTKHFRQIIPPPYFSSLFLGGKTVLQLFNGEWKFISGDYSCGVAGLLPVTTDDKCLFVIKHQERMDIFTPNQKGVFALKVNLYPSPEFRCETKTNWQSRD